MKTIYYINNNDIAERKCSILSDFNKDDNVYYDPSDKNIHITLIDQSHIGETVKVRIEWNNTLFIGLDDNNDDLTDVIPAEEVYKFTMTEFDRIELSYKKHVSSFDSGSPVYQDTDESIRLISIDSDRYNELLSLI